MLEAFQFAKAEVARAYEREGLLMTEHAMLDDNGDKEGTQKFIATSKDGKVAGIAVARRHRRRTGAGRPEGRALYEERRELERRIERLRLMKDSMEPARYTSELEKLGDRSSRARRRKSAPPKAARSSARPDLARIRRDREPNGE